MARRKCTPFGTFGTTFPPKGELLAVLCIEVLMRPKAERRANFPLRGKWCAAPKGVHFHRAKPGCTVFHSAERNYKTHRPKGDTTPSEPFEPFEPSEPSRPKGVSIGDTTTLSSRRPLRPLERSEHNPSIQPAPSGAPLFILRRQPPPQPSVRRPVEL